MSFWCGVLAIVRKDFLSEMRTREILFSVVVFALLVLVIFSFAFRATPEVTVQVAPGIIWVTFAFAGVLSLNRAFIPEKEEGCLEGLMVSPVSRGAIYTGKMLGSLLFLIVIEAVVLGAFALLFNVPAISGQMAVITLLATVGFVAVGVLFSALAVNTRAREMVLPVLFLPVVVPVVIAAVRASTLALSGGEWAGMAIWLQLLAAFDIIFITVSLLTFSFVIEE